MAKYPDYPVPHLHGRIDYSGEHSFAPDGDTVHLLDPVLLVGGRAIKPANGRLEVWTTGSTRPKRIVVRRPAKPYVPIRFEGIDAPEEHYRATPFELQKPDGTKVKIGFDPSKPHPEVCQQMWKPATDYVLRTLQRAGWALILLDREVTDHYGRVLGYVYASDREAARGTFVSLQLVARGLAFPFLFESAGDAIPKFLEAADRARGEARGVWTDYQDAPLPYSSAYPAPPSYTSPSTVPASAKLNMPVVFRRIVDSEQLLGLSLQEALRKYDVIDFETGEVVTGDRYESIPLGRRVWAQHGRG